MKEHVNYEFEHNSCWSEDLGDEEKLGRKELREAKRLVTSS